MQLKNSSQIGKWDLNVSFETREKRREFQVTTIDVDLTKLQKLGIFDRIALLVIICKTVAAQIYLLN